jgi:peptide/nickel transport system substrate-binding protein
MGRLPRGGKLAFRLPLATGAIDPHDLFDPLAAVVGRAIADTLYDRDAKGRYFAALADGMPKSDGGETVVRLRPGLRTANGTAIGAREVVASIRRSKAIATGVIDLDAATDRTDPLLLRFGSTNASDVTRILASPLTAIMPPFLATAPDGTGAFRAFPSGRELRLERNPRACRGAAFLDEVRVRAAADLSESLTAFDSGSDDLGWLGTGLHGGRPGTRRFAFGIVGWVVLCTGNHAGTFGTPGSAQQLANAVPVERLALGLGARADLKAGSNWLGDPSPLHFPDDTPHLAAVARAVATQLSTPGHELTATGVARAAFRRMRASGDYTLAVDFVRDPDIGPSSALIAMATADRPSLGRDMARHPPKIGSGQHLHHLTTTLRVGILGSLAVHGGVVGVQLVPARGDRGFELGSCFRE